MNPARPASTRPVSQTSSRSRIMGLQHPLHQHQPLHRQRGPAPITAPPSSSAAQSAVSSASPSSLASDCVTESKSIIASQVSTFHPRRWTIRSETSRKWTISKTSPPSRKWTTSKPSSRKSAPRTNLAGSYLRITNQLKCGLLLPPSAHRKKGALLARSAHIP